MAGICVNQSSCHFWGKGQAFRGPLYLGWFTLGLYCKADGVILQLHFMYSHFFIKGQDCSGQRLLMAGKLWPRIRDPSSVDHLYIHHS